MTENSGKLHVVYDNVSLRQDLQPDWGFSCYIELPDQRILFDTGTDGGLLLENIKRMELDINAITAVSISHAHSDHAGGLSAVLSSINNRITVYVPDSFPEQFILQVEVMGARCEKVNSAETIFPGVYTTGEMGIDIHEQAMVLDTVDGLVIITGCAHPGILEIMERVVDQFDRKIRLLIGGFHLKDTELHEVQCICEGLESLGVENIAPAHCTGKEAIEIIHRHFGNRAYRCGVGLTIPLAGLYE